MSAEALEVGQYRDWLTGQGFSGTTVAIRVTLASRLLVEWGTWDQPPTVVASWLSQYDQWTRRTYQNHLTSLYRYLVEVEALRVSPVARIRATPMPDPRPKPLSDADLATVLATADGDLRAWLLLASKAGLRAHEVAKVRGEDVDAFGLTVRGKGGKVARLPVHPLLRELAEEYPAGGYWFPANGGHVTAHAVTTRVGKHFRAHGIEDGGIHRCRHTYGTHLVRAGTPIHVVRDLMRHSSLATTQAYLGVNEDERLAAIASI
jgi:integrase/recombinase XerD